MAENVRPPVAIRIVRPYESEDEFLDAELETVGKTSVILIGAHPRPTGVILRFEVTLTSGATVLRGEGRVLAHKENAFRGQPGLSLRFTRLDPRSKALVDRTAAMREARAGTREGPQSQPAPAPSPSRPSPPRADAALTQALTSETPPPAPARASRGPRSEPARALDAVHAPDAIVAHAMPPPAATSPPSGAFASAPPPLPTLLQGDEAPTHVETRTDYAPPLALPTEAPAAPEASAPSRAPREPTDRTRALSPPPERDALLDRLRARAATLPKDRADAILAARGGR